MAPLTTGETACFSFIHDCREIQPLQESGVRQLLTSWLPEQTLPGKGGGALLQVTISSSGHRALQSEEGNLLDFHF